MLLGRNKTTFGLGDASTSTIRNWVQNMKAQEGGRAPDVHKVNGNMDWHERSGNTSKPIYQLYKSFNKDSSKFLDHLKSQVPDEFPGYTASSDPVPKGEGNHCQVIDDPTRDPSCPQYIPTSNGNGSNGSGSDNGDPDVDLDKWQAPQNGGNGSSDTIIPGVKNQYLWYGGAAAGGLLLLTMFTN